MRKTTLLSVIFFLSTIFLSAGENYQLGVKITRMTAVVDGIMVMISGPLPDNARGSYAGWLLIKKENSTIIEAAFYAYHNEKVIDIYTLPRGDNSVAEVNQIDLRAP